jgi:tRNA pseudouridine13 synthase
MKLKQAPEDFQVEEVTEVTPGPTGPHALYRMEKSGWTTHDALAAIRRRWKIDLRRLSYGGLKDRHAQTVQHLSIFHGPRRGLSHNTIKLTYLGQVPHPFRSEDIACNRFRIILRDLPPEARAEAEERLRAVAILGVPNYFDDQRFGSVPGAGSEFIARLLVKGQLEEALKLALTGPYSHDDAATRDEKATLLRLWGDWAAAKDALPRSHARSLVDYLRVHPGDFRGAVARLRPELRGLYLSAYQSYLWNRILGRWVERHATRHRLLYLKLGPLPMPLEVPDPEAYFALQLPLPTSRWKPSEDDPRLPLVQETLAEDGVTLRDLQVRGVREMFFSRGDRQACLRPMGLTHEWSDDERHPGRLKLALSFALPRGAYATLVVKAALG